MSVRAQQTEVGDDSHVVHFYDRDQELVEGVVAHFAAALSRGGTAISIATPEHQAGIRDGLSAAGIDPADPAIVWLDAQGTLDRFTTDDEVDRARFRRVVGEVVTRAVAAGGPVHAFGEMVALLWNPGNVAGVIKLEELWNELGRELEFKLLCGYLSDDMADPGRADSVAHICQLHSAVLTPRRREVAMELEPTAGAPAAARSFVTTMLADWGHGDELVADAQLVVSELVTNAILHARSSFAVVASSDESGVRVAVRDRGAGAPELLRPEPHVPSGRGLLVIDAVAAAWGVETTGEGKTVWAQLRN
jgi:anti-sigma regulatory factor (Ser/Thr protein kinase)